MKIQRVKIKNFLVLKDFEAELNGANVLLIADNERGKSSLIRFIEIALGKQTEIPIGAEGEGVVIADRDGANWTFHVKFKSGKPFITITSPDGLTDTSKSALAKIVGAIDFNIDEFVAMSDTTSGRKKQVELYKGFLPQETQDFIKEQEQRVVKSYDQRTELNREAKTLEGYLAEHKFKKYVEQLPDKPIDITELSEKIKVAMAANEKIREVEQRMADRVKSIKDAEDTIKQLQEKIAELEKSQIAAREWLKTNSLVDVTEMMAQKDKAHEINSALSDKADYDAKMVQFSTIKEEAGEMTAFIESSRGTIEEAIKDCDVPVDGLSFDSEGLIYNGIPVSTANLSTSAIMELGIKLKIAQNPDFGVLFIQRSESIGKQRWEDIQEIAKKNNFQIIAEKVERGVDKLTIELIGE
jgi:ribosomal protein L29